MTISLCMIVKNEEAVLGRCLDSIDGIVDEIIIVDTGSVDHTKVIAKAYTDKIFDFEWNDDFAAARNYSFSKASMDYIMWLDADDIILQCEYVKLLQLKNELDGFMDVILMKYGIGVDENNRVTHSFFRERIIRNGSQYQWVGRVHEYLKVEGNLLQTDITIVHKPEKKQSDRNLNILEKIIYGNEFVSSRDYYYYAKELQTNGFDEEAFRYFQKYLVTEPVSKIYVADVCMSMAVYYMNHNMSDEALKILIHSMEYGIIKPEILCLIGSLYKEKQDYTKAVSWYELIFKILIPKFDLEMHSYDLGGFIPCLDLCYCYYQLGEFDKSFQYNELAAKYKPDDPIVLYNREELRKVGISCIL